MQGLSWEHCLNRDSEVARLRLATALSVAQSVGEVSSAVADWAAPAAGASFANFALYDPDRNSVRVVHAPSLPDEVAERWAEIPIDTPTPLCEAILTGHSVLLGDLKAIGEHYRALLEDTIRSGLTATASIPLRNRDGSTIGAVGLAWPEPQGFLPEVVSRTELVAELVAHALRRLGGTQQRADQAPNRSQIVQTQAVQDLILTTALPHGDDLNVATAYLPASQAPFGGDWYDTFPVEQGTFLVIGDVAGHGTNAAAAMAELKFAIRAFASESPDPAVVVGRLNKMICRLHPGLTATVIVALWNPHTRTFLRCNAGHPPVLRCRVGEFDYLRLRGGPNQLLGVDPHSSYRAEAKELRPGTTLLLYTDGLIEHPPRSISDTMDDLLHVTEHLPSVSPQRLIDDILLWRLRQGPCRDDLAMMAVRLS